MAPSVDTVDPLRRTLLQSLAAVVVTPSLAGKAAGAPQATFGDAERATLHAIADVALPSALDDTERNAVVTQFVAWHRNYREGADRGHGYGSSTLAAPAGPPPAARYPAQFAALDASAKADGAASFAALGRDARRRLVEAALNTPQPVNRLPARPTGANLVADFMGLYFNGASAWDLAYQAEIGRDSCRTLAGSERAPSARGGGSTPTLRGGGSTPTPRGGG
jgi:hypothetical protein